MPTTANTPLADVATRGTVAEQPILAERKVGRPRKNPEAPRPVGLSVKAKKPVPKQVRKRKAAEELPAPPRRSTRTKKLLNECLDEAKLAGEGMFHFSFVPS